MPPSCMSERITPMNEETHSLLNRMNRRFWIWAAADAAIFILIFFLHRAGITPSVTPPILRGLGITFLILTALACAAAPIMIRSVYVSRTLKTGRFHPANYGDLQVRLISLSMAGALFAAGSYLFLVPKLHLYAAMIAALYGVYSAIPAKKKIQGEINYFGAKCS